MLKKLLVLFTVFAFPALSYAQLDISTTGTDYTIDFDSTLSGVNNGVFDGSGFAPTPALGQLNSGAWSITGLSDGTLSFNGTANSGDFARGNSSGGVNTGGVYAFDVSPGDRALGFQSIGTDLTPGEIILKIQNNTGNIIENITLDYTVYEYNNEERSTSLNFSYSNNNSSYTAVGALDFQSTEAAAVTPTWLSFARNTQITGLSIANGTFFYLRWQTDDFSGSSGSRDELAIDNMVINASSVNAPTQAQINAYSSDRMNISWTKPTGTHGTDWDGVLAFISDGPNGIDLSSSGLDGADYMADTSFAQGTFASDAGSLDSAYCVANLTTDSDGDIDITGLTPGNQYYLYLLAYREIIGNNDDDEFSSVIDGVSETVNLEGVTNLSATATNQKVILNWNNNSFSNPEYWQEVIVVARDGSAVEASVSSAQLSGISNSSFTAKSNWNTRGNGNDIYNASGSLVGTDNTNYIVYAGTGNSASITGLTNGNTYHFRVFTFFSPDNNRWSNGLDANGTPANTAAAFLQQDFEAVPATPELQFTGNGSFAVGNGIGPSDPKYVSGSRGYEFNNNSSGEILCNTLDASQLSSIELTFRLAAFSANATSNGLDSQDEIHVDISTDGGANWSEELEISGNNSSRWSFASGTGTASTAYDGDNSPASIAPAGGGERTTDGYSTVTVSNLPSSNQLRMRIRVENDDASEFWVVDDLSLNAIETRPQIVLSDNGTQIAAGNVNQAAINHVLSQIEVAVTDADASVTQFSVQTAGTYTAGANSDIANFKLRYSTDATLDAGDTTLDQINAIPASGNNLIFSGLSQSITAGTSGYFFVTTDIEASATPSNTVGLLTPALAFSGVNDLNGNTITTGGLQTIQSTSPAITLADNGSPIGAGSVDQNELNYVLATFQITASNANVQFEGLNVPTSGSYTASDIDQLQLWQSADSAFDPNADQVISNISSVAGSTTEVFSFSGVNQHVILSGNTDYFFITADLNCTTNISNSISVGSIATSDLTFGGSPNLFGGPTSASGTQAFDEATPDTIASIQLTALNQSATVAWNNPSNGCFDDFLVVVHSSAISGSPTGSYTVNSPDYTDATNSNFPGGGKTVYLGSNSPQTITGLTNGTDYTFKIFAKNGATWETVGVEGITTPVSPPSNGDLLISAVYDGVRSGQTPKGIELYAVHTVEDLSFYSIGSANNGGGSAGPEFQLASASLNAGEYYYLASESSEFNAFFGFNPDETNGTVFNLNGDDAIELFLDASKDFSGSESVVDIFGDINSTAGGWGYADGWAARNNATGPDGSVWNINNWRFGSLTGSNNAVNNSQAEPVPIELYSEIAGYVLKSSGNWSPENPVGVSTSNDNITIQASETLTGNVICDDLTVQGGNTLTVPSNNSLTVDGAITNNGTIHVQNNASIVQTASADNNSGSGTYQIVRNTGSLVSNTYYNFWSSPVQADSLTSVFPNTNTADFYSHLNGSWAAASGTMTPGMGYTATGDINATYPTSFDRTFSGDINNGPLTLSVSAGANDYILVGNPYPSAIDYFAFFQDNTGNISANKWYWDHTNNVSGDYAQRNGSGGTAGNSGISPNSFTSTAQGFFLQATGSLSTITFENDQRVAGNNDQFFTPALNEVNRAWLNLTNDQGAFNQILVAFSNEATDGEDRMLDGKKLKGNSQLAFYSKLNGYDYGIQAVKKPTVTQGKVIELGVDAYVTGEFAISLDSLDHWPSHYSLILVDTQERIEIDLLSDSTYAFEVNQTGSLDQRFYLNIERNVDGNNASNDEGAFMNPSTAVEDLQADYENTKVYQAQDLLWIDGVNTTLNITEVDLITVKGQTVRTERFENGNKRQSVPTANLAQGIYFVRIAATNGQVINRKVFIR